MGRALQGALLVAFAWAAGAAVSQADVPDPVETGYNQYSAVTELATNQLPSISPPHNPAGTAIDNLIVPVAGAHENALLLTDSDRLARYCERSEGSGVYCLGEHVHTYEDATAYINKAYKRDSGIDYVNSVCAKLDERKGDRIRIACDGGAVYLPDVDGANRGTYYTVSAQHSDGSRAHYMFGDAAY